MFPHLHLRLFIFTPSVPRNHSSREEKMWLVPRITGAIPSERWGHSACYCNGLFYVFGGCRGGMHFKDVLVFDMCTMTWNLAKTSGTCPGPRDSHSAVVFDHRMFVFGGMNGLKKVNDLHILDLVSLEWSLPKCKGTSPSARESHTANIVDDKMIIFGGSGQGEANYLNDLHILDLNKMEWFSPAVQGSLPPPRDSHSSVAVGNQLFVFGGDSGDGYQNDIHMFDLNTLIWSKIDFHGASPAARAGHASVSIGTKIYVFGGVGDRTSYKDIWVLDLITSSWFQLGTLPHGRFSHTANATKMGVTIFGGCGENERPLNDLLILQEVSTNLDEHEARELKRRRTHLKELDFITNSYSPPTIHHKKESYQKNALFGTRPHPQGHSTSLIGAEVHGQVDAAFNSGYLMTVMVNGTILKGLLFPSGLDSDSKSLHRSMINTCDTYSHREESQQETRTTTMASVAGGDHLHGAALTLGSPSAPEMAADDQLNSVVLSLASPGAGLNHF